MKDSTAASNLPFVLSAIVVALLAGAIAFAIVTWESAVPSMAGKVRIVTAANFATNGNCHDHFTDGCDLYSAVLDLSTGDVSDVTRLTSDPLGEAWPQISADGKTVAFVRFAADGPSDTMYLDLLTATSRMLARGSNHAALLPDGSGALVTMNPGQALKQVLFANAGHPLGAESIATGVQEPHVSPDGSMVAYYHLSGEGRGSGTAQAKVLLLSDGTTTDASEADGTAHCFWNFDGSKLYCNNAKSGGVMVRDVSPDGDVGPESVGIKFPTVAALAAVDPAYGSGTCRSASVQYGSFCDATHVAMVAGCVGKTEEGPSTQVFSHAVLLDIETGKIVPIGASMASEFGGSGSSSWTTSCGSL